MSAHERPVILVVRDGWGVNPREEGNAVAAARTPNMDRYRREYPHTILDASGLDVGLPAGYQGSSEVGHLNMGAGRIVIQELLRINKAIESGELFREENFIRLVRAATQPGATLHIMGLIQDEGVHAHQDHLYAILREAKRSGVERCYVHFFADGRDTAPRSSLHYLRLLEEQFADIGLGRVGTLMGRYYGMDRGEEWGLIDRAYAAIVDARGFRRCATAEEAIRVSYEQDKTPDGDPMFDEYIPPTVIGDYPGVRDGDAVLHYNYRQDRALELTRAFVDDDYPGRRDRRPDVVYAGLTRYYDEFPYYIIGALDEGGGMEELLGEVISDRGIRQLRIAETQKFKHVTSFFNGKQTTPYELEDQVRVPGEFDPATFASHPEMNARDVLDELLLRLDACPYGFIAVNWANCDMVGHTGDFDAAVKAVEIVDECVGKLVDAALPLGARLLITADHGNAEEMLDFGRLDPETGKPEPKTAHTTNAVELFYVAEDAANVKLIEHGKLCDVAPTILELMGIPVPEEMRTATSEALALLDMPLEKARARSLLA